MTDTPSSARSSRGWRWSTPSASATRRATESRGTGSSACRLRRPRALERRRWARSEIPQLEQAADPVRRPETQKGLALYLLLRDGAEVARVAGVGPVVAHHEDVALRDRRRGGEAPVWEPTVYVRFPLALAVHQQLAAADRDLISRHAHHALYEVLAAPLDALEDDYVPALGLREAVDKFVDEHPIPDLQGRDHALRGNVEGLHDERPDEAEDERERDEQYDQELEHAPAPL